MNIINCSLTYNFFYQDNKEGENMKRIEIHHKKDLEKLKEIKGKEYIFLKIYPEFNHCTLEAIQLPNFYGTIDISFEESNKPFFYKILASSKQNTVAFFENVRNYQVHTSRNVVVKFNYLIQQITKYVSNMKQLEEAINDPKIKSIVIKNDLVITNQLPTTNKEINVNYNVIYITQENVKKLPFLKNSRIELVDKIFLINDIEDLSQLSELTNEKVVVSIEKDFTNFELASISLENFTGVMYFLGNEHKLSNGVIRGRRRVGLFSKVHNYGSIFFQDFSLEKIKYTGSSTTFIGGFLGARKGISQNYYASSKGQIEFSNCHIKNCFFCVYGRVNPFVGKPEEDFCFYSCSVKNLHVFHDEMKLTSYDGYYVQTIISQENDYYDSWSYDNSITLKRRKY